MPLTAIQKVRVFVECDSCDRSICLEQIASATAESDLRRLAEQLFKFIDGELVFCDETCRSRHYEPQSTQEDSNDSSI